MKRILLLITILPLFSFSQVRFATEVDFRNTILQSGLNETQGYNGTIKLGYASGHFQAEAFAEVYPNIDYTSIGMNIYYIFNPESKLRPLIGLQLSTINRNSAHVVNGQNIYGKLNGSFGANASLEWHFTNWGFLSARWEMKYRSDLQTFEQQKNKEQPFMDYMRGSGFVGIGYKF